MAKSGAKPRGRMTGKSSRNKIDDKASKARARMAKRAKRARFLKENKKRITYGVLGFIGFLFFAFFTPFGPDYYYERLQQRKWESNGVIKSGYLSDLNKLASFYSMTFRSGKAAETYDEVGKIYYGFSFSEFAPEPGSAFEKRAERLADIERGRASGPPFKVPDSDLPAVGYAALYAAEVFQGNGRRGFAKNLIKDLLLDDFIAEHPSAMPPKFVENVRTRAITL